MGKKAMWEVSGEMIMGSKILRVIPKVGAKEAEKIRVAQGTSARSLDGGIEVCDQRIERRVGRHKTCEETKKLTAGTLAE